MLAEVLRSGVPRESVLDIIVNVRSSDVDVTILIEQPHNDAAYIQLLTSSSQNAILSTCSPNSCYNIEVGSAVSLLASFVLVLAALLLVL